MVKSILGRRDETRIRNEKVNEFNSKLIGHVGGEPLFDLARIESTTPDGRRVTVEEGEKKMNTVVRDYTSDGGHLNELGRRIVAAEFVHVLAKSLREGGGISAQK